jgi:DNA-binding transcriptional regulator YiaG
MAATSSAELIRRIGTALYGSGYQHELAAALQINRRTVSRWSLGQIEPRTGVWGKLIELIHQRRGELGELLRSVERHSRSAGER